MSYDVNSKIRYLTDDNAVFVKTSGAMLSVTVEGQEHPVVYLHCSFPHTSREQFISVRTIDNEEIGIIRSLDDFPQATQKLLREQIQIRYFAPKITKLIKVKDEFGYSFFDTETTAGSCRFTVRRGGRNMKMVTEKTLLITDVDGNRFIIEDLYQMSDKEYRMIELSL